MKHFYLILTFLCISFSYGQNSQGNGDIKGFKLYPNPVTNGKVYISTSENGPKKILIYDVLGTQVFESKINEDELYLSNIDAGVYVLRVYQNNKVATRKLIIK
ncbi:T9SS type A sorting domain-containing protein [Zobellia uliginosa]|uniref:T9SS type A sorting domain-containing protein n=1 Tax=Zobellia uliginosa TaxID=143224 RepID=UPI001C075FE2|nr:T9SS type A sorting domain-containing protein [Zobellia uliginosa]MBU2947847.1 T9SS type A sorting domain-containing protein [Zobellia uliginosa]